MSATVGHFNAGRQASASRRSLRPPSPSRVAHSRTRDGLDHSVADPRPGCHLRGGRPPGRMREAQLTRRICSRGISRRLRTRRRTLPFLSPVDALTTGSALAESLGRLIAAAIVWGSVIGRRCPPSGSVCERAHRPASRPIGGCARHRRLGEFQLLLALAFLTPVNDGDALWYHLAAATASRSRESSTSTELARPNTQWPSTRRRGRDALHDASRGNGPLRRTTGARRVRCSLVCVAGLARARRVDRSQALRSASLRRVARRGCTSLGRPMTSS